MRKRNCKWSAILLGTILLAGCCSAEEKTKQENPSGILEVNEIAIFCACPCECCRKCPKCQKNPCRKAVCPGKKNCPADAPHGNHSVKCGKCADEKCAKDKDASSAHPAEQPKQ